MKFAKTLKIISLAAVLSAFFLPIHHAAAVSRIKDIADFEGVRDNQLIGYGLIVGLNGTGDNIKSVDFAKESLISMLDMNGINARSGQIKAKNVAAVMVTANLPAFARQGSRIDVTVSALGDAKNLLGGTLIATPLKGADGEVYAVAQGTVATGAVSAGNQTQGSSVLKGVPTSGRIANGAIVEREIDFDLNSLDTMNIALRNPDFTTSRRIADAINAMLGTTAAKALDPGTVNMAIPTAYKENIVDLMTKVEQLQVQPDATAKVVIDESTGIVVIGKDVKINRLAIAQGNLTIKITDIPLVSQPEPFSLGETVVMTPELVEVEEDTEAKMKVLDTGINLQELVDGLNALGVTPRDLISILQAIKASGALQAEIEVI
ncbi:MAG: flagellar basal body P-ring protein FlgI [bacterium]|nr:flagellar basal body P-ring protein FlgI [bacterium]MDY2829936.1 flagellar basal body P-ring protein FlgI [Alphaproteobacteria bacterium]